MKDRLLNWYRVEQRALPWRITPSPYRIWLSEIMCQQTRIDTVLPYYARFLARWPSVEALAGAPLDDVLKEWAGLGYYSRARNLHKAAKIVAELGGFPDSLKGLKALPGVGDYTAAAIASIAFGQDEALVDGNVERVLSRYFGIDLDVRSKEGKKALWAKAREILPAGEADQWNQALMEWGALLCHPKKPLCERCPLSEDCVARREGRIAALPYKAKKIRPQRVYAACGVFRSDGAVLVMKRPETGLLGGLWEFPGTAMAPEEPSEAGLAQAWAEQTGMQLEHVKELGQIRHVFTHRDLRLHVYTVEGDSGSLRLGPRLKLVQHVERGDLALSRLTEKVIHLAGLS